MLRVLNPLMQTHKVLPEILEELTPEALEDFNNFVKVANNLKRLAKTCNPSVVRESAKLEKYKRIAIDTIRRDWLERRIITDETARKAINYIYEIYQEALDDAEDYLEICFK